LILALLLVGMSVQEPSSAVDWVYTLAVASVLVLAGGIAGWGVAVIARTATAAIDEHFARVSRRSEERAAQSAQVITLLQRIAQSLESQAGSGGASPGANIEQSRSFAVERAIRNGQWSEAERLLCQYESDFPSDPRSAEYRRELVAARQVEIQDRLAQLEAAQEVNDPERVLELYQALASVLESDARAPLEKKLAPWFLALIHRRLRIGKIQTDVVLLAGRFAETFATTHEGASVHAALPTLRRSVGLCPRCAQTYTGLAEACPRCLGGGTPGVASNAASPEPAEPG
jgi:hypothetical protein